jgi:hypothetical protein
MQFAGPQVAMLDAKAASDLGWETAAKRADAMEKLVDRKVFKDRAARWRADLIDARILLV